MAKPKKRSWFKILRRLIMLLLICLVTLFALLHTPFIQDKIADKLSAALSQQGFQVELSGLRSRWPFHLHLGQVLISDINGVWLRAEKVTVDWKLQKQLFLIHNLEVEELELSQRPSFPERSPEASAPPPSFAGLSRGVEISKIHIPSLWVGESIVGTASTGSLTGNLLLPAHSPDLRTALVLVLNEIELDTQAEIQLEPFALSAQAKATVARGHHLTASIHLKENNLTVDAQVNSPDTFALLELIENRFEGFGFHSQLITRYLPFREDKPFSAELNTALTLGNEELRIENELRFSGGTATVPLSLHLPSKRLELRVNTDIKDVQPAGSLIGQTFTGALQGDLNLIYDKGVQLFSVHFSTEDLRYQKILLDQVTGKISSEKNGWHLNLNAERGEAEKTQRLSTELVYQSTAEGWRLHSERLEVEAFKLTLKNTETLLLTFSADRYSIHPTTFSLNEIPIQLRGNWDSEQLDVKATIPKIDTTVLPSHELMSLQGSAEGIIHIQGPWAQPDAKLGLSFKGLELLIGDFEADIRLDGTLEGDWTSEGLMLEGQIADNRENTLRLEVNSPEGWRLKPFHIPDADADFSSRLYGSLDLAVLNRFNWLPGQRVTGNFNSDIQFSQQKGEKELQGNATLSGGNYENYNLGTKLQEMEVDLQIQDLAVEIQHASARSLGNGEISAEGKWDLHDFPGSGKITCTLDNTRVLHLDPVQAALSGNLSFSSKPGENLRLDGDLVLAETTFHMDRLPKPIAKPLPFQIKGTEQTENPTESPSEEGEAEPPQFIHGDVRLDIPSSLTVEGSNLYSTWEGRFRISLLKGGVFLDGKMAPRRGTVSFFGRSFRLARGTVHFNDLIGTSPILDLEADYFREDLDATLKITGRAEDPRFKLTSNPPLPDDEILSRILFGKDMSTITGLQAMEVGLAVKSMVDTEGSDWDVMGKARDFLGVDQLELRESGDAQGSTEIVAGRQLSNRLYLEFNQSLKNSGSRVLLEYEVRRNLSISTETGTHILPGIGVNWKRDY